jgi:hypothetical protein
MVDLLTGHLLHYEAISEDFDLRRLSESVALRLNLTTSESTDWGWLLFSLAISALSGAQRQVPSSFYEPRAVAASSAYH